MKRLIIAFLISIISITFSGCTNDKVSDPSLKESNNEIKNKKEDVPHALEVTVTKDDYDLIKPNESSENETNNVSPITPREETTTISLNDQKFGWGFRKGSNGSLPDPGKEYSELLSKYNGYYLGDTSKKVVYLTFDNGYENGYTSKILDTLKENNVQATFFVTKPYITGQKDLVKRMVNEGHIVGNHSTTHPSMPSIQDINKFKWELETLSEAYKSVTGQEMKKYFRPPMGEFSERSLYYTKQLGYKSILWSFAYNDWDPNSQPSREFALKNIKDNMHNGEIFLLHSVSKTNCEILDEAIKYWKSQGYEIKSLDDL